MIGVIGIIGLFCLAYAAFLWRYANCALRHNRLKLVKRTQKPKIAVLIPARFESAVIGGLLESLTRQTVKVAMKDVYVIIESMDDPAVEICKSYGCSVILRKHLERQRKGYALDEALQQILASGARYDLYFIFDADNRLASTYVEEMLKIYAIGYQMATGYRNAKNNNRNVIAAVSALTFTMINTLGNKYRIRHGANIIFSGTGCYIEGDLVERWGGWPFHSLTEDYEMSLYAILHNISTFYNEKAVFYDEQPTYYKQTVDQRVRWIKGYFSARHQYVPKMRRREVGDNQGSLVKEKIGVRPVIWALIGVICLLFNNIVELFTEQNVGIIVGMLVGLILLVYIILMAITISMIRQEKMRFTSRIKWQAILFNPIYLSTYISCALRALFTKDVAWKRIEHGKARRS